MLNERGEEIVGKTAHGHANRTKIDKVDIKLSTAPKKEGIIKTKILTESGKEVVSKTAHGHAHKTKIDKKEEVGDDDA